MRHQYQGSAIGRVEIEQLPHHTLAGGCIEIAGGFVRKQHRRSRHEGARNGHALLFTAGQLIGIVAGACFEADVFQRRHCGFTCQRLTGKLERQHDILHCRERWNQVEALKHKAHVLGTYRGAAVFIESREFRAVESYIAGTRYIQAGEQCQQRGFTGTRSADNGHGFTGADGEGHLFKNGQAAFGTANLFAQIFRGQYRRAIHALRIHVVKFMPLVAARLKDALALLILLLACTTSNRAAAAPTILVMGDSLSAGYGIHVDNGWVKLLAKRLATQGYEYQVVNASVTGETTGGGKVRLPGLLNTHKPTVVILELGPNDGLRGLPIRQMRDNLAAMIENARAANATVLLVGMQIPPNYGEQYASAFSNVYGELAKSYHLNLVPFFLDGVALDSAQMQGDNLHPNESAQPRLLDNVWSKLKPLLTKPTPAKQKS